MLAFAAREADIVSLAVTSWDFRAEGGPSLESTRRKVSWVNEAAATRSGDVELEILISVRFGASREAVLAETSARSGTPLKSSRAHPI